MPGKKISDLDVYDDVNSDKSRKNLYEVSKNTGTYASPTYATNGSRKITQEQLREELNIKEYLVRDFIVVGSGGTIVEDKVNAIIVTANETFTLPTASSSNYGKSIVIANRCDYTVTINGIVNGSSIKLTNFNEVIQLSCLFDGVSTYGWWLVSDAINDKICTNRVILNTNTYTAKHNDSIKADALSIGSDVDITIPTAGIEGRLIYVYYPTGSPTAYVVNLIGGFSATLVQLDYFLIRDNGTYWEAISTSQNVAVTPDLDAVTTVGSTTTNDITVGSATLSNTTVSTLPFIDSAKKIISATGALLGTWFQTLTADTNPVDADTIVVNDSTASFEAKKTTLLQLWSNYLLGKVQALGYLIGSGLTTNNTLKWNGSQIVNANETDNGTTITSTLNRVFTGASGNSNGTGVNSNKFLFDGNNTSASASGSFIQVAPQMQVPAGSIGGSLRGIVFLDGNANSYVNNGFNQLYINSGGDLVDSKITLRRAIYINHRSADTVNNGNANASAVTIDAQMYRPTISSVTRNGIGVHHITSVNADNYSSIIQAGASGSNPIHYSAYSQRDNAIAFSHYKDATVSSGILNHARNKLVSVTTSFSNGFGFKNENFFLTSNASTIVQLDEEYIVQNVGSGTTTSGKRYRHISSTNGVATAYIMGLYASGVIIGNTTALPNSNASLHLQSTSKGFLPNVLTTAQRDAVSWVAGDAGMIIYNSTTNKHQGWNGTTWNDMY